MRCPWCGTEASPRVLHRHLVDAHGDAVAVVADGGRSRYETTCPLCDAHLGRTVKPFAHDPGFVDEHREQVLLVAFDVLVHHLLVAHDADDSGGADDRSGSNDE